MKVLGCTMLFALSCSAQSARQYFDELYKSGDLSKMADQYVCFDEDPTLQNFFTFRTSESLKEDFQRRGTLSKMPKATRDMLSKEFLYVRSYSKGALLGDGDMYFKDDGGWSTDFEMNRKPMRMQLNITWGTLRYKRAVEELTRSKTVKTELTSRYGRCEEIPHN